MWNLPGTGKTRSFFRVWHNIFDLDGIDLDEEIGVWIEQTDDY